MRLTTALPPARLGLGSCAAWQAAVLGRLPFRARWAMAQALAHARLRTDEVFRGLLFTHVALALRDRPVAEQAEVVRQAAVEFHFAMLDRYRLWRLPGSELTDAVRLEGAEHLLSLWGREPVVLLCPHFVGLEAAAQRLALEGPAMTLYQPGPRPELEALRHAARRRFNDQLLLPVGAPLHRVARELHRGRMLFLLPDLDTGGHDASLFVPWFGWPASTVRTPAWLARRLGAHLLPVSIVHEGHGRYGLQIHPRLPPLPESDLEAAACINACLERLVLQAPSQYWWTHPRYLTPPPGHPTPYDEVLLRRLQTEAKRG